MESRAHLLVHKTDFGGFELGDQVLIKVQGKLLLANVTNLDKPCKLFHRLHLRLPFVFNQENVGVSVRFRHFSASTNEWNEEDASVILLDQGEASSASSLVLNSCTELVAPMLKANLWKEHILPVDKDRMHQVRQPDQNLEKIRELQEFEKNPCFRVKKRPLDLLNDRIRGLQEELELAQEAREDAKRQAV